MRRENESSKSKPAPKKAEDGKKSKIASSS
jgi:hypothetical protein